TFFRLREKFAPLGYVRRLHWTRHPDKARGLYYDERGKPRSPWYDEQEATAPSKQWLAQEIDIDVQASAFQYFDPDKLANIIERDAIAPLAKGELEFDPLDVRRPATFLPLPEGPLWLWVLLDALGNPP